MFRKKKKNLCSRWNKNPLPSELKKITASKSFEQGSLKQLNCLDVKSSTKNLTKNLREKICVSLSHLKVV